MVPVILDVICENVVVWRTEAMSENERRELHVQPGEICFCRVFAKSGSGRQDATPQHDTSDNEDDYAQDL